MGCRVSLQVHPMPVPEAPNITELEVGEDDEESENLEDFTPRLEEFVMNTINI